MKKFLIGIAVVLLLSVLYTQKRDFYCIDNGKYITVWKTINNTCYIVLGHYYGLLKPSKNYIETTNTNALTILYDRRSAFDFIICNDYDKKVEIKVLSYKIKYYDYGRRNKFIQRYFLNGKVKKDIKYMMIDIKEKVVVLNGNKL